MSTDPSRIAINDVLLGRGGATNNHEGNKRYRTIVSFHQPEYLIARKKDKALISKRIVAIVKANGGRFLRRDASSRWVEIPDKKAIEKTSQALREGLDVRNHTVRPQKQVRRHLSLNEESTQVIVSGFVVPNNNGAPTAPASAATPNAPEPSLLVPVTEATARAPMTAMPLPAQALPAHLRMGVLVPVIPQGFTIPVNAIPVPAPAPVVKRPSVPAAEPVKSVSEKPAAVPSAAAPKPTKVEAPAAKPAEAPAAVPAAAARPTEEAKPAVSAAPPTKEATKPVTKQVPDLKDEQSSRPAVVTTDEKDA